MTVGFTALAAGCAAVALVPTLSLGSDGQLREDAGVREPARVLGL